MSALRKSGKVRLLRFRTAFTLSGERRLRRWSVLSVWVTDLRVVLKIRWLHWIRIRRHLVGHLSWRHLTWHRHLSMLHLPRWWHLSRHRHLARRHLPLRWHIWRILIVRRHSRSRRLKLVWWHIHIRRKAHARWIRILAWLRISRRRSHSMRWVPLIRRLVLEIRWILSWERIRWLLLGTS